MEKKEATRAGTPRRFASQSPPSLLIVAKAPDLQAFLRGSLERWYQVAVASDGTEASQHLKHCPPQGLIVGKLTARGEESLVPALQSEDAPPALKLWSTHPPADWADQALRHPFMRVDLLRAVDQLIHTQDRSVESAKTDRPPEPSSFRAQNGG